MGDLKDVQSLSDSHTHIGYRVVVSDRKGGGILRLANLDPLNIIIVQGTNWNQFDLSLLPAQRNNQLFARNIDDLVESL